jgi:glycosyltransferase involved in cell wall biosynthesis
MEHRRELRVVQVSPFYSPVVGGVETVVRQVAEYLASRGVESWVVTYDRLRRGKAKLPREEEIGGVKVIRLRPDLKWSHGTYSRELIPYLQRLRPDVVHVHVWRHPHVFQVAKIEGLTKVLQPHSPFYGLTQVGPLIRVYYALTDLLGGKTMRKYRVVSITPLERDRLREVFGVSSDLIPNGIPDSLFSLSPGRSDHYLFLGRISREKNVMLMLRAFKSSGVNRKLIMAGPDGGLGHTVRRFVERNALNVDYLGPVSSETKMEMIRNCRAVLNPSPYEGFGITLLEGEAMGKPAIIVGRGGQEYAAPPNVASIRAENSEFSVAEAVRAMEDDEIHSKLSVGARMWAENFKLSKVLPRFLSLYESLTRR